MRKRSEKGQAVILVVAAMALVLVGALGLAIDGASLYGNRQMAQSAADAAAQAGILSIFDGTNIGTNLFGSAAHLCTATDAITPCVYARKNGFGASADDAVVVDFPSAATVGLDPAILPAAASVPVSIIRVTITRSVHNNIIRMLGASATTPVKALAVAAICDVVSPVPIIVLHPTRPTGTTAKNGSFFINGNPTVTICGGPTRSIQVNSDSGSSITVKGASSIVDLSHAGPADPGNCSTGTGAEFGDYGGPDPYPGTVSFGSTGSWIFPASPIPDPLYWGSSTPPLVSQPTTTGLTTNPATLTIKVGDAVRYGCPAGISCTLYSPGLYTTGIKVKNDFALFKPGIYYISGGGLTFDSGSGAAMATSVGPPSYSGFSGGGMLVFNSGNNASNDVISFAADAGKNGGITLTGADQGLPYENILFFEDRTTTMAHTHTLQGGGAVSLTGTIYLTNPWPHADLDLYQTLLLQGTPGSTTTLTGEIITDVLELGGNGGITMDLNPYDGLHVRKVALVK